MRWGGALRAALVVVASAPAFSCYEAVVVCRQRGEGVVCAKRHIPRGGRPSALDDERELPESSDLRVAYDEGSGPQLRDPVTLIGKRVRMQLVSGDERWVKVVDVADDVIVVNFHGSEWSHPAADIALMLPLRD